MQYEPLFQSMATASGQRVRATSFANDEDVITFVKNNPETVESFTNAENLRNDTWGSPKLAKPAKAGGGATPAQAPVLPAD